MGVLNIHFKCLMHSRNNYKINYLNLSLLGFFNQIRFFHTKILKSDKRIGPHNVDVISLLIGTLIGDANLMQRSAGDKKKSTRVRFRQSIIHKDYIFHLYDFFFYERGYCFSIGPSFYK